MPVEIPLKPIAFNSIPVVLDDELFILQTVWRDRDEVWKLNILDGDRNEIVMGLSLLPSRALTVEYRYAEDTPKGLLAVDSKNSSTFKPVFESLGSSMKLLYYPEAELNELL